MRKFFLSPKHFDRNFLAKKKWVWKILGKHVFGPKMSGSKKFLVQNDVGSKEILSLKKFGLQKFCSVLISNSGDMASYLLLNYRETKTKNLAKPVLDIAA